MTKIIIFVSPIIWPHKKKTPFLTGLKKIIWEENCYQKKLLKALKTQKNLKKLKHYT